MAVMTPRPAQPTPGSGPPDSTHFDVAVADLHHHLEFQVLHAAGLGGQVHDGVLGLLVQHQAGRVGLGIAADDHDLLLGFRQRRHQVLRGG